MRSVELVEAAEEGIHEQALAFTEMLLDDDMPMALAGLSDPIIHSRPINPYREFDRPAEQARYALSRGADPLEANLKAQDKAVQLAKDDLQLTRRKAPLAVFQGSDKILGYRRVIMPELSVSGTCGLCLAASTRLYTKRELLPIHTNCNCEIMPVTKTRDPGRLFNEEDLQDLYAAVGGNTAADLLGIRYQVGEHGELGPILERPHKERLGLSPTRDEKKEQAADNTPAAEEPVDWSDPIENLEGRMESVGRQIMRLERKRAKGQSVDDELKTAHDELRRLKRRMRK